MINPTNADASNSLATRRKKHLRRDHCQRLILSSLGACLLAGVFTHGGPVHGQQASETTQRSPIATSDRLMRNDEILGERPWMNGGETSNRTGNHSSLMKHIVLGPFRWGKDIINAIFRIKDKSSFSGSTATSNPETSATSSTAKIRLLGGNSRKITGIVVAYNQLMSLANITDAPQQQVLVVRSQTPAGQSPTYLKVVYTYGIDEPLVPDAVLDGKTVFNFTLKRNRRCDGSLRESQARDNNGIVVETWKATVAGEELPFETNLRCYTLRPKGLKPAAVPTTP